MVTDKHERKANDAGMVLDAVFENSTVQDRPWIRTILEDWGFREGWVLNPPLLCTACPTLLDTGFQMSLCKYKDLFYCSSFHNQLLVDLSVIVMLQQWPGREGLVLYPGIPVDLQSSWHRNGWLEYQQVADGVCKTQSPLHNPLDIGSWQPHKTSVGIIKVSW